MNGQGQEHVLMDGSALVARKAIVLDCESVLGSLLTDALTLWYIASTTGLWILFVDSYESDILLQAIHGGATVNATHINNMKGARFYVDASTPPQPLRIPAGQYKSIIVLSGGGGDIDGATCELFIEREFSSARRSNTTTDPLPARAVASGTLDVDTDPQNSEITVNDAGGPIDFEALGVEAGDTLVLVGRNRNMIVHVTAVATVTITFDNTIDAVKLDDADPGTAYSIANQANFGINADNWLGAAIVF